MALPELFDGLVTFFGNYHNSLFAVWQDAHVLTLSKVSHCLVVSQRQELVVEHAFGECEAVPLSLPQRYLIDAHVWSQKHFFLFIFSQFDKFWEQSLCDNNTSNDAKLPYKSKSERLQPFKKPFSDQDQHEWEYPLENKKENEFLHKWGICNLPSRQITGVFFLNSA